MANSIRSGICSVQGFGIDFDRRERAQPTGVKTGGLGGSGCVSTELGCEFQEIVPDSDEEETGRQEKLRKGSIRERRLFGLRNGTPLVNGCLSAEGEDCRVVADSEEESDGGKQSVLNEHDGVSKKRLEWVNGSQQPGGSSQADALKFVDHFLKCNALDLSSEGKSRSFVKPISPPMLCSKGVTTVAGKIGNRTPVVGCDSYDWIDNKPNKKSTLCSKSDVFFYSRRKKRSNNMTVIATVKSVNDNLGIVSNHQESEEVTNLPNEFNDEVQTSKTLISRSAEVENLGNVPEAITGNNDKDSNVVTNEKLHNSGVDEEGGNEPFDDVFNTQMAAEVMETLLFEPPKKWNPLILSESCETIITDYRNNFNEKEASVGYSSMPNRSRSDLEVNGDRIKRTKRSKGKSGSQNCGFHKNDRLMDPHISIGKEDMVCNAKHNSGKLFLKTDMERMGSRESGECCDNVDKEPHLISLDYNPFRGLPKRCFETKISSSASPVRWLSKDRQLTEQKSVNSKGLVYTYKRRRSALVRKENKCPNVKLDKAEIKSNIENRKEHKGLPTVIPGDGALNYLVFPKGKRTKRGSSNIRHSERFGNVRSDADTEKELRCHVAKRYKPANHLSKPAWEKFPRKKRTAAAFSKQVNIWDSLKIASRRSNSDFNKLRSCVRGAGKNAIIDDSSIFHSSDSLTSVSSNGGMMPLVSSSKSGHFEKLPAKMLNPSLIKELVQLGGFSDIPLYSSCKNLRRRKHVANVRVLLSQHLDNDTIMQQKNVLARLGISIATCASDATHFVTNTFSRTKNMLEAISLGIPIVTQLWLESCEEAGCLVDEKSYILKDSRKEREIGFSLSVSLAKASRCPILKDRKVFITPNIKPDKGMLSGLVKMVQGEVVDLTKNNNIPEDVIVLSCEEDYSICTPFLEKGIPAYHSELLLNGIVTQKLDIQRHQLFRDRVKRPPSCSKIKR